MRNLATLAALMLLLTACDGGWSVGNGVDVRFSADNCAPVDAVPMAERATPTAETPPMPTRAPTQTATPTGVLCVVVANGGLNVRATANGVKVGAVWNGAEVVKVREDGDWYEIESPVTGWVYGAFVECEN